MPLSFGYTLDKFLGKGNSSVETRTEEYFRKDFSIQLEVQVPPLLFFTDRSGFILDYKYTVIDDPRENQLLAVVTTSLEDPKEAYKTAEKYVDLMIQHLEISKK